MEIGGKFSKMASEIKLKTNLLQSDFQVKKMKKKSRHTLGKPFFVNFDYFCKHY